MIILQLVLVIGFVVCVRWIVPTLFKPDTAVSWAHGTGSWSGVVITPGDDVIGSGDPFAWTALDEFQLRRLLRESP